MNRRNGGQRGGTIAADPSEGTMLHKSVVWVAFHCVCCVVTFALGFRFTRLLFFLFLSAAPAPAPPNTHRFIPLTSAPSAPLPNATRRVVAGRHGILIRPWPHPDPHQTMRAHHIISTVQSYQRVRFGVKSPRQLIVVTPTYVRTFQRMHLTSLMHSLMLSPYPLHWIIVEAGGITNETRAIYHGSGLTVIHVPFQQRMPNTWEDRHKMETRMRIRALREIKARKLDGIVLFGDDSNMHTIEFFDEVQKLKWFGSLSIGILAHSDEDSTGSGSGSGSGTHLPLQGPACNSSKKLVGWHSFDSEFYNGSSAVYIDDLASVLPRRFEWAGFAMNSRLLWKRDEETPLWFVDVDSPLVQITSPLSLVKDLTAVEPLGNCGKKVLVWWLRVEARFDSKFPPGWIIDPPLEITVPAKDTRWPIYNEGAPERKMEILSANRSKSRSKHRSNRKHEAEKHDSSSVI